MVSPTELVGRIFATFDAKDVSGFAAFMADDIRLVVGNEQMVQGKPAFVAAVNAFLGSVASYRHELVNVWTDADVVIVECDVHYTRLDGGEVTLPCCNVLRLRDVLVAEYRTYIDIAPVYA